MGRKILHRPIKNKIIPDVTLKISFVHRQMRSSFLPPLDSWAGGRATAAFFSDVTARAISHLLPSIGLPCLLLATLPRPCHARALYIYLSFSRPFCACEIYSHVMRFFIALQGCELFPPLDRRGEREVLCFCTTKTPGNNNYLFDKKKVKLFFTGFFSSAKKSCFITSAPGGRGWGAGEKNPVENDMKFCFLNDLHR
jgi:hypothetical protein